MKVIKPLTVTTGMLTSSTAPENDYAVWSASTIYSVGTRVISTTTHRIYESLQGSTSVATMTIATPCVVTWAAHGLVANTAIQFTTTGALPTGIVSGTVYYVLAPTTDTFNVSATAGGAAINTTGTQSGVHTATAGGNYNKLPSSYLTGATPYWIDVAPTNRWAMFDQETSTITTIASPLTVVLSAGLFNSLAMIELAGTAYSVDLTVDAVNVYSRSGSLDGTIIVDWYQYFFEEFSTVGSVVFTDVPAYSTGVLTVSITGGTVSCGGLILGTNYYIGDTESGASAGIIDYSIKSTNTFGATTILKRKYSKRSNLKMLLDNSTLNKTYNVLADVRSTPCIWIGDDDGTLSPFTIFGFYRDFNIDVAYSNISYCTLEIEGMT